MANTIIEKDHETLLRFIAFLCFVGALWTLYIYKLFKDGQ
jgi:hypothetical protein